MNRSCTPHPDRKDHLPAITQLLSCLQTTNKSTVSCTVPSTYIVLDFFCRKRSTHDVFFRVSYLSSIRHGNISHAHHTYFYTHAHPTCCCNEIYSRKKLSKEYWRRVTRHKSLSCTTIFQSRSAGEYLMNHVLRECTHRTRSTINYWSGFCPNKVVTARYLYHMPRSTLRTCHRNHHAVLRRQISGRICVLNRDNRVINT